MLEISTSGVNASSWNGDGSGFPSSNAPFLICGGGYSNSSTAGIFSFQISSGSTGYNYGFRSVLVTQ